MGKPFPALQRQRLGTTPSFYSVLSSVSLSPPGRKSYRIIAYTSGLVSQQTLNLALTRAILWRVKDQQRGGYNDGTPPRVVATRRSTRSSKNTTAESSRHRRRKS